MAQTRLEVKTADGVAECSVHTPAGAGPWPAVLFFMDALGVRPALTQMAQRLASLGYFVLMPNILYRSGDFPPFDPKSVWTVPAERERLMAIIKTIDLASAMRDAAACLDAVAQQKRALSGPVGCVGYCLGGRLAFATAGTFPQRVAAAASIHGGNLVGDAPDSPHLKATAITAQLYFAVADNDRSCTPEHQAQLEAALDAAKVRYQLERYPGALHGFAVPDLPVYDARAAEQHWERVTALFAEALPGK